MLLASLLSDANGLTSFVAAVVVVLAGAVWLRSALVKQRHEELAALAETRAQTIDDLRSRVDELETWKHQMSGKFEALESLKVERIVDGVVAAIAPLIGSE